MSALTLESKIEELVLRDQRYASEAYHFVFEALDYISERPGHRLRATRHITVSQLLQGIRELALQEFGPLARQVLESWGVFRTDDFGEIVFRMIDFDLLNRSDADQREDFRGAFSFHEAFDESYRPTLHREA